MRIPRFLLRHRVVVEPYLGVWGSYGPPATSGPCFVQQKLTGSQAQAGVQRVTRYTIVADLDFGCPEGSRVTLPDGRAGYVSARADHDAGGLPVPEHAELDVAVGSEYGPPNGELVTILHRVAVGEDRYHNIRYATTAVDVPGAAVRPLSSNEAGAGAGRDQITDAIEVILPPGTAIGVNDRMRVRGLVYEVDGTPEQQRDPMTGVESGVRAIGKRVSG